MLLPVYSSVCVCVYVCVCLTLVNPTSPCFEATYAAFRGDPTRPFTDDILIILPHP